MFKKLAKSKAGRFGTLTATIAVASGLVVPMAGAAEEPKDLNSDKKSEDVNYTGFETDENGLWSSTAPEEDENGTDENFDYTYGGKEEPINNSNGFYSGGIVWGVNQDGSYMIPLAKGGELQGWCIDPGRMMPKADPAARYGDPEPWGGNLSSDNKKRLGVALALGGTITQPGDTVDFGVINQGLGAIDDLKNRLQGLAKQFNVPVNLDAMMQGATGLSKLPTNVDKNVAAAAISGVVHQVGWETDALQGSGSRPFDINRLDPKAREIYDAIWNAAPKLPPGAEGFVDFSIRKEVSGKATQRMIAMDDIKVDWTGLISFIPKFKWPDGGTPNTPPDTPDTPNTPPTRETEPETPGTPGTPSEDGGTVTPPTTPTTSSTPKERKKTTTKKKKEIEIKTSAGTKTENVVEQGVTITDTVTYSGLEKGKTYTLVGETVDKATGQKDGNKGEVTFKAKESNGRIDVPITLNNATGDELVVFETLHEGKDSSKKPVAVHEDINDQAQTIGRVETTPEISTTVSTNTGNVIQSGTMVTDTVMYKNLVPGRNYRLEARLMCKETGADTGASQTKEFTPEEANGQVNVDNIAVTDPDCHTQVAFEKLYEIRDGQSYLVAKHEDINDAAQTFGGKETMKAIGKKKKKTPTPAPVDTPTTVKTETTTQPAPAPQQQQQQQQAAGGPGGAGGPGAAAPGGGGNGTGNGSGVGTPGAGGGGLVPRQVIVSVPSGESDGYGATIFAR